MADDEVLNLPTGLPVGQYMFIFGVDTVMDGLLDSLGQTYLGLLGVVVQDPS